MSLKNVQSVLLSIIFCKITILLIVKHQSIKLMGYILWTLSLQIITIKLNHPCRNKSDSWFKQTTVGQNFLTTSIKMALCQMTFSRMNLIETIQSVILCMIFWKITILLNVKHQSIKLMGYILWTISLKIITIKLNHPCRNKSDSWFK